MSHIYQLAGHQTLVDLQDYQVEELVYKRIPQNSFSSVQVQQVYWRFPSMKDDKKILTRKITLERSTLSVGWECVRGFFTEIFSPKTSSERYRNEPLHIRGALIKSFIGCDKNMSEEDIENGEKELIIAYNRCVKIVIYISDDCNWIDAGPLEECQSLTTSRKCYIF